MIIEPVPAKRERTWSVIKESTYTSTGYRATLAKLDNEYAAVAGFNIAIWLAAIFTWLADFDIVGSDPRFRVLVGRTGTEEVVGVRQARTLHTAEAQMAEIEAILSEADEQTIRDRLDLDF